jgi:hypothetical protein
MALDAQARLLFDYGMYDAGMYRSLCLLVIWIKAKIVDQNISESVRPIFYKRN